MEPTNVSNPEVSASKAPEVPVRLTSAAVSKVKEFMAAQQMNVLTVRVVPAGCSGLGYDLQVELAARPEDLTWDQDGVSLATDPMSAKLLLGTELDYVVGDYQAGFRFNNPNAKQSCGCGSSFSA